MVSPINEYPNPAEESLQDLIHERDDFLAAWTARAKAVDAVQLWLEYPTINLASGRVWHLVPARSSENCFRDAVQAFIIGRGMNGQYYTRVVEVGLRAFEDHTANDVLIDTLATVTVKGPGVCTVLDRDGGAFPRYEEQPPLGV